MGRAKLAMEYIKKDKARNTTFDKRKKGLKKKAQELATLCDVPLCVLIYQGPNSEVDTFPENGDLVRSVIDRYVSVPREENSKRSLNLQDVLDSRKKKKAAAGDDQQQQLSKLQNNNNNNNGPYNSYPSWMPDLNGCSKEELLRLADVLDYKMQAVEERIGNMRGDFGNYGGGNGNGNAIVTTNGGGDVQIGGYENGMHWPMGVWQASGGGGGDGSSSGGSITMAPCTYYDPNVLTGNNMYYGQVGPHGVLAANTSNGGSGVVAQPMYGGSVRFEPRQMGGGQYKWCEEGRFF